MKPNTLIDLAAIPIAERRIIAGLYLSKYDSLGLQMLGFSSFKEAYNVFGYALLGRPQSIKNYRDEFDPLFPNDRKGWHKRQTRDYCLQVFDRFKDLDLESFTALVRSFFGYEESIPSTVAAAPERRDDGTSSFAQRLITGLAAERYFESVHAALPEFQGYSLENTTRYGCGYDFRLRSRPDDVDFLAVEVKGLKLMTGSVSMTANEYEVAAALKDRFFLFVVRNFRETPTHEIVKNPLHSQLRFRRVEQVIVQVSWLTSI